MKTELVSSMQLKDGDVIYIEGYRVVVSGLWKTLLPRREDYNMSPVANFILNSHPEAVGLKRLPNGYEGMNSAGNGYDRRAREISQ